MLVAYPSHYVVHPVIEAWAYTSTESLGTYDIPFVATAPSGITAGELLLIFGQSDATSTISTPSGFNQFFHHVNGPATQFCFWKYATGSETNTNVTQSNGSSDLVMWFVRISGIHPTAAMDDYSGDNLTSPSDAYSQIPSATKNFHKMLGLWLCGNDDYITSMEVKAGRGWSLTDFQDSQGYATLGWGQRNCNHAGEIMDVLIKHAYETTQHTQIMIRPLGT